MTAQGSQAPRARLDADQIGGAGGLLELAQSPHDSCQQRNMHRRPVRCTPGLVIEAGARHAGVITNEIVQPLVAVRCERDAALGDVLRPGDLRLAVALASPRPLEPAGALAA